MVAVVCATAIAFVVWHQARLPPPAVASPAPAADGHSAVTEPAASPGLPLVTELGSAPPTSSWNSPARVLAARQALAASSLRGTEPDGGITVDRDGKLVADLNLRRLFDYYHALIGEIDLADIRLLLWSDALNRAGGAAADAALALFDRYIDMLKALDGSEPGLQLLTTLERLERASAIRRTHLGAELADTFFAEEEAAARFAALAQSLNKDPSLSAAERQAALAVAETQLPSGLREDLNALREGPRQVAVAEQISTLDLEQRDAQRRAAFGPEVAARLATLDAQNAQWDARFGDYRAYAQSLASKPVSEREAALTSYRAQHFSEPEARRVLSLDEIARRGASGD